MAPTDRLGKLFRSGLGGLRWSSKGPEGYGELVQIELAIAATVSVIAVLLLFVAGQQVYFGGGRPPLWPQAVLPVTLLGLGWVWIYRILRARS